MNDKFTSLFPSQLFFDDNDMWRVKCLELAQALVTVLDGVKDHDIEYETGLTPEEAEDIIQSRKDARLLLEVK